MKKLLLPLLTILLFGCSNSIDDSFNDRLNDLENRVAKLEELCNKMNTNISSLQTIITALQTNDYITSITPITENGIEIGYTIAFSKASPITIYHGKDGQDGNDGKDGTNGKDGINGIDGHTPIIGVRKDVDGIYYWVLDGEWMLDEKGNKIKAVGTDGQNGQDGVDGENGKDGENGSDGNDGITPQLKIEDGFWKISYDNGDTWVTLGKATGENGEDGIDGKDGNSMFKEVYQDDYNVYFILTNGTEITLPKQKEFSVQFSETDIVIIAGGTATISYSITGATEEALVKAIAPNKWSAEVNKTSYNTGTIKVTAPSPITDEEIIVFVYDGKDRTIMASLNFVSGIITPSKDVHEIGREGGKLEVTLTTNMDYQVQIPTEATSWISLIETKSMRTDVLTFSCTANSEGARYATISIVDGNGIEVSSFNILQKGSVFSLAYCLVEDGNYDYIYSEDGNLKYEYDEPISTGEIIPLILLQRTLSYCRSILITSDFDWQVKSIPSWCYDLRKNQGNAGEMVELELEFDFSKGDPAKCNEEPIIFFDRSNPDVTYTYNVQIML